MAEFLNQAFTFPTIIFSILLGFVVLYWLFVIIGALDLDVLDAAAGLDGAEGALDGVAEGATEAAAEAAGVESVGGGLPAVLSALGLTGVPVTISFSLFVFLAWFLTFAGMNLLSDNGPDFSTPLVAGGAVALAALGLSIAGTALAIRPMRRFFITHHAIKKHSLVGKVCTVITLKVDRTFGEAELEDGGSSLLLQARCSKENALTRGSKALIFDYDTKEDIFHVVPFTGALDESTNKESMGSH